MVDPGFALSVAPDKARTLCVTGFGGGFEFTLNAVPFRSAVQSARQLINVLKENIEKMLAFFIIQSILVAIMKNFMNTILITCSWRWRS